MLALVILFSVALRPLAVLRPNRIAAAVPKPLWEALAPAMAAGLAAAMLLAAAVLAAKTPAALRLAAATLGLAVLGLSLGGAATALTPPGDPYARVSPGSGAWLTLGALALGLADALVRLRPGPALRVAALGIAGAALAGFLLSGHWAALSVLKEHAARAESFGRELRTHAALALGSSLAAVALGWPLALSCRNGARLRAPLLAGLNLVQTIPSLALFGLLIAPLAWIAARVPAAADLGIAGIGAAPAVIALFLYALLPVVASTLNGLDGVPGAVTEAADGMGMTPAQRLWQVELPLALPQMLAGVRIVLVQNIGLAVIAGLIGGGGLGVFVFQGLSQTAADLVLLGALPVVAMAMSAAILLDALVEALS